MATIGLDKLYYAKITDSENGEERRPLRRRCIKAPNGTSSARMIQKTRQSGK